MLPKETRNYPGINIKDLKGLTVPFVFNNGVAYDGTENYIYNPKFQKEGFFIVPAGTGIYSVQLFGQEDNETYTITAAEVTASQGRVLPYRLKAVYSATTVTSSNIVW